MPLVEETREAAPGRRRRGWWWLLVLPLLLLLFLGFTAVRVVDVQVGGTVVLLGGTYPGVTPRKGPGFHRYDVPPLSGELRLRDGRGFWLGSGRMVWVEVGGYVYGLMWFEGRSK